MTIILTQQGTSPRTKSPRENQRAQGETNVTRELGCGPAPLWLAHVYRAPANVTVVYTGPCVDSVRACTAARVQHLPSSSCPTLPRAPPPLSLIKQPDSAGSGRIPNFAPAPLQRLVKEPCLAWMSHDLHTCPALFGAIFATQGRALFLETGTRS